MGNMDKKMKIAYLAPEIPALSATFVYNEILSLEKDGLTIVPISVHVPGTKALEGPAQELSGRTCYLYSLPRHVLIRNVAAMLFGRPGRFFRALSCAVRDALEVGLVNHTGMGILFRFFAASTVARILILQGCTHLHAHFAHIPTDLAMYASLLSGIPYSFTAHANDIFVRGWNLDKKVERSAFAVTISGFNREYLTERGADRNKIHVIHCGVDSGSFARKETTFLQQPLRLGSLGRMVEKKGFDILIEACRTLKDSRIPFCLELAGDGPLQNDLIRQVQSLGLSGVVRFIGPLPHDHVPGWLKSLDIFVLPCKKDSEGDMDGIPVVLMEAMLSGVPVVSTRLTGIPELVKDTETGYLADPGDAPGLASAIITAIRGDQLRESIILNAAGMVATEFDLSKNARLLAGLFGGSSQ